MVTTPPPSRFQRLLVIAGCLTLVALLYAGFQWANSDGLTAARLAMAERRDAEAIVLLDEALLRRRSAAEAAYLMARCHRRLGEVRDFRRSLTLATNLGFAPAVLDREQTLFLIQAGQLAVNSSEALSLLADPGDDTLDIYEAVVRGCLTTLQFDEAERFLDGWRADFPDDPLPFYYDGLIAESHGNWPAAVENLLAAIDRGMPPRGDALVHLAEAQRRAYRYHDALSTYARCDTTRVDVMRGRAACLEALRDLDGARETYRELLERFPDDTASLTAAGRLDAKRGEHASAKHLLERAIALSPSDVRAWHALAWSLVNLGEADRATDAFREAVRLTDQIQHTERLRRRVDEDPRDVRARLQLAEVMLREGRTQDGLMWLNSVLTLDPANTAARALLDSQPPREEQVDAPPTAPPNS